LTLTWSQCRLLNVTLRPHSKTVDTSSRKTNTGRETMDKCR
jgi:hypothetical protein